MSRWQFYSLFVLLGCFVIMGVWDGFAIYFQGRKSSLSYLITMATYHAPIVAFAFGVLAGHLFWPQTSYQEDSMQILRVEITRDDNGHIIRQTERIVTGIDEK